MVTAIAAPTQQIAPAPQAPAPALAQESATAQPPIVTAIAAPTQQIAPAPQAPASTPAQAGAAAQPPMVTAVAAPTQQIAPAPQAPAAALAQQGMGIASAQSAELDRLRTEAEQSRRSAEQSRMETERLRVVLASQNTPPSQSPMSPAPVTPAADRNATPPQTAGNTQTVIVVPQALQAPPATDPQVAADIARLRAEAEQARRDAAEAVQALERQRAETERLRGQSDARSTQQSGQIQQLERNQGQDRQAIEIQRAETERLRSQSEARGAQQSGQIQQLERNQVQDRAASQTTTRRVDRLESVVGEIILPINERADNWILRAPAIPIQQHQFCRIIDRFHDDLAQVYRVRNDIRRNTLYRDRQADLASLLPNGSFENWLVRVVEVTQAPDGSAAVLLQPPCRVMLGSDACQRNGSEIRATVKPDTPLYRELGRVGNGDFVAVSGIVLFAQQEQRGQALPQYAMYQPGTHCSATDGTQMQDVFVTQIRYLVQLR
jgi:hypothetical protein